jgi:hypothetical protein
MKSLLTALAACTAMSIGAGASAALTLTWDGSTNTAWRNPANWVGGTTFPGDASRTDDIVVIDNVDTSGGSAQAQPAYSANTTTVDTITIDADANARAMTLTVSGGTLTPTGLTRVVAEKSSNVNATLLVTVANAFVPEQFEFEGDTDNGIAVGDFEASVTVDGNNNHSGTDTLIEGMVDFYVGNAMVHLRDLEMGANADLYVLGEHANSVLRMSSFDLVVGASDYRPMTLEAAAASQLVFEIP